MEKSIKVRLEVYTSNGKNVKGREIVWRGYNVWNCWTN